MVAIMQAKMVGQPEHKPIYFCVDTGVLKDGDPPYEKCPYIQEIKDYFSGIYDCFVNKTLNSFEYEIGIYSGGFTCDTIEEFLGKKTNSRCVYKMLAGAVGWADTKANRLDDSKWNIMQDLILHDVYAYDDVNDIIVEREKEYYGKYDINTSSTRRDFGGWHRSTEE